MTPFDILILLAIGAVCGVVAQWLIGYSHGGCLFSSVLGLVGAFLGDWLARALEMPPVITLKIEGKPFPFFWAIVGATLFAFVLSFFTRRSGKS